MESSVWENYLVFWMDDILAVADGSISRILSGA